MCDDAGPEGSNARTGNGGTMKLIRKRSLPGQLSLLPEIAFCKSCGRKLVDEVSVKRCRGPNCWAKYNKLRTKRKRVKHVRRSDSDNPN